MKILMVFLAICISFACFSQKKDYLIKNNGDTLRGDVTLMDKVFYVNGVSVQTVDASEVMKIKSRNYKGNTVVSGKLLTYTDNLLDLSIDYMQRGVTDTVLVLQEIYTSPKINLYFVKNNFETQFYFYKTPADPKPVQLVVFYCLQGGYDNFYRDRGKYSGDRSKIMVFENRGYVNQLKAVMENCKQIPATVWELLTYRDYSLKKVMKLYNECN